MLRPRQSWEVQHSRQRSAASKGQSRSPAGQAHCPFGWHSRPPVQAGVHDPLPGTQVPLTQDCPAPQLPLPQNPPQPSGPQVLPAQEGLHEAGFFLFLFLFLRFFSALTASP
jgi:hypothetical protein